MTAFWILAPVMVLAALGILFVHKAVHAAMLLAVVMLSLAVLYAALDAPFLFAVQIIVYTGAILMLFLFVVMLVGVDASDSLVETIRGQRALAIIGRPAARAAAGHRACPRWHSARWSGSMRANADGNIQALADILFSRLRLRLRDHLGAADHRRPGRHGARPPGAAHAQGQPGRAWPRSGCATTPSRASTSGRCRSPGVFARHNAVDTAALLPDGTAAESSVSRVLAARGTVRSAPAMADHIEEIQRQLGAGWTRAPEVAGKSGAAASTEEQP